jgi:hypothetical protein
MSRRNKRPAQAGMLRCSPAAQSSNIAVGHKASATRSVLFSLTA